jgi:hypothetical protein
VSGRGKGILRRPAGLVALTCVLASVLTLPAPDGADAGVKLPRRECPNVGPPQTDVGLYNIITRHIVCGKARAILRDWYHDPSQKDSGPAGWRCAQARHGRYAIRSYCHRNGKQISFDRYLA